MDPLSIIAFFDGRLGHEKQTRGVLKALADQTVVAVQYKTIPSLSFVSAMKNWCTYIAALVFSPKMRPNFRVDLIIGSGSYTHIPMLLGTSHKLAWVFLP